MANKNTFAVPCNQEINVDIIEKKQVSASLGMLLKLIFLLFYPIMHFVQILSLVFPKYQCLNCLGSFLENVDA